MPKGKTFSSKEEADVAFLSLINKNGPSGCWVWMGPKSKPGYGSFGNKFGAKMAYRYSYEFFRHKIPGGMCLDHLCKNKSCVNPYHLEVVTNVENLNRCIKWQTNKTHCKHGHEFTEENTYLVQRPSGTISRYCRICGNNRSKNKKIDADVVVDVKELEMKTNLEFKKEIDLERNKLVNGKKRSLVEIAADYGVMRQQIYYQFELARSKPNEKCKLKKIK